MAQLAAGESHSLALGHDGSVRAFGRNHYGQLGDGTTTQRTTPVQVTALGSSVMAVAAGYAHSLVLHTY